MKNILIIILALFGMIHTAKSNQATWESSEYPKLVILSTSDINGNFDNFAKLSTVVNFYREKYKNVLLVNSGNSFYGWPFTNNTFAPGKPIFDLMDTIGYDAVTLGRRIFNFDEKILYDRISECKNLSIIATNIIKNDTPIYCPLLKDYLVKKFDRIKKNIVIYGLVDSNNEISSNFKWLLISNDQYRSIIKDLPDNQSGNYVILLSHLGPIRDDQFKNFTPNINLVIGGKAHPVLLSGKGVNSTQYVYNGSHLSHVGMTLVVFDQKGENILFTHTKHIILNDIIPNDPKISELVTKYTEAKHFENIIGTAQENISNYTLCHLICEAMRESTGAEFALFFDEGMKNNPIPKGPIQLKHIIEADPTQSNLYLIEMTRNDIEDLLLNQHIFDNQEGNITNKLHASGFEYKLFNLQSHTTLISNLDDHKTYKVIINENLYPYLEIKNRDKANKIQRSISSALTDLIQRKHFIANIIDEKSY